MLGKERFLYPDQHIEADNRLSWMLGSLDRCFGNEAYYVHLMRNKRETVRSYNRRWVRNSSLIRAFSEGIQQIGLHKMDDQRRLDVVSDFYDLVQDNIRHFLKDKTHRMELHLENIEEEFPEFWKWIGAEGDLEAALDTLSRKHNQSKTAKIKRFRHEFRFGLMKLRRRMF
jgi:hypothetical protein